MCEICQKMQCPVACPAYDAAQARRRRRAARGRGIAFLGMDRANHLENQMMNGETDTKKGGKNEEKNVAGISVGGT